MWAPGKSLILKSRSQPNCFFSINFHYNRFLAHVTKQLSYNGRWMSTRGPSTTPAPCILFIRKLTQKKLNDSSDGLLQEAEQTYLSLLCSISGLHSPSLGLCCTPDTGMQTHVAIMPGEYKSRHTKKGTWSLERPVWGDLGEIKWRIWV